MIYQGLVILPYHFSVEVDVISYLARVGVLCELLYADDLVPMSETIEGLSNKSI